MRLVSLERGVAAALNDRSGVTDITDSEHSKQIGRRLLLQRGAIGAAALLGSSFMSACGSSSSPVANSGTSAGKPPQAADVTGQAVFLNYPGWIGPHDVANFQKKYPQATIKQTSSGFESLGGVANTVAQNPKAYDMLLGDVTIAQQLAAGNFLLPIDQISVPGLSYVQPRMRKIFPYGLPWDSGYAGIAYRKDIVKEPITSWADFWKLAPKYSGKVMVNGTDRAAMGAALIHTGHTVNSADSKSLNDATNALLSIKSDIRAFKTTGIGQALHTGDAVLAIDYNFDVVAAQLTDPRIGFVTAAEGSPGYVEGIIGVAQTGVADVVRAFMDFEIQPTTYASFINAVASSRTSTAADKMIDKALLVPALDLPENTQIFNFQGADGVKRFSEAWSKIQGG